MFNVQTCHQCVLSFAYPNKQPAMVTLSEIRTINKELILLDYTVYAHIIQKATNQDIIYYGKVIKNKSWIEPRKSNYTAEEKQHKAINVRVI